MTESQAPVLPLLGASRVGDADSPSTIDPAGDERAPGTDAMEDPILVVMWRGHRVRVVADGRLASGEDGAGQRRHLAMGDVATAVANADTVDEMVRALRASSLGAIHDVVLRIALGELQILLRERAPSGTGGVDG